ncbi:MAG: AMP-binding protein [Spongiibacteraceae bacterium]
MTGNAIKGRVQHATVLERLAELARSEGRAQPALRDVHRALSYGELHDAVVEIANWLRTLHCRVIGLQVENSIDWVLLDLACQAAAVVCLPLPDFFSASQQQHCLHTAGVDLLITDRLLPEPQTAEQRTAARADAIGTAAPRSIPHAARLTARQVQASAGNAQSWPQGTAKITFTSGSTGTPKGVCLSAALQWQVAQSLADAIAVRAVRHLCLLPLATLLENVAGIYAPLLCGGEVILPDAKTRGLSGSSGLDIAALLHCLDTEQPESLILLPQLLRALVGACLQGWRPPAALRFVAVGGARVAPELIAEARRHGLPVYEGYGLSECGSVVALNTPAHDAPGSVGRVLPHCRVTIDAGEIVVAGAGHLGYLGEPASWFPAHVATGDLGSIGVDSFLHVSGRRKNLLITGYGRNVSPEWIESALLAAPLLTQCVVVGDARPYLIAIVSAAIAVDDTAIQRWLDTVNLQLPDYAQVRNFLRIDTAAWSPLLTANGRPNRGLIDTQLGASIEQLYATADIQNISA